MGRTRKVSGALVILLGLCDNSNSRRTAGKEVRRENHAADLNYFVLSSESSDTKVRFFWRMGSCCCAKSCARLVPRCHLSIDSHFVSSMGEFNDFHFIDQVLIFSFQAPPSERGMIGTYCYSGAQFGTVLMLAVSGVLASSAMGWPSIFYLSGVAGLVWSILYFFYGSSSPSDCSGRISSEEKNFIERSLNTGSHGSGVSNLHSELELVIHLSLFVESSEDSVEGAFNITTSLCSDDCSLRSQLVRVT